MFALAVFGHRRTFLAATGGEQTDECEHDIYGVAFFHESELKSLRVEKFKSLRVLFKRFKGF